MLQTVHGEMIIPFQARRLVQLNSKNVGITEVFEIKREPSMSSIGLILSREQLRATKRWPPAQKRSIMLKKRKMSLLELCICSNM